MTYYWLGVPHRFLWLVIFVAGMTGTVISLVNVIADYLEYDDNTYMKLVKKTNVDFPAVTVCNQNRVDCSRLGRLLQDCQDPTNTTTCGLGPQYSRQ